MIRKDSILYLYIICILALFHNLCFAKTPEELTKCICEGKAGELACLEELKNTSFENNKYADFAELLKGLCPENKAIEPAIDYYLALTRSSQLKYLEDTKSWDEYFAKGNDYRDDLVKSAQKAISLTTTRNALNINSKLLLYQFYKDQMSASSDTILADLIWSVGEYSQSGNDINTIKVVADKLVGYNEKGKAKELYKIYARKLAGSEVKDAELKNIAAGFYKEGNLELSESIYDIYIERISTRPAKGKLPPELINIAKDFTYRDAGSSDPFYAEKVFKKIEEIGGKKAFDESLIYLRGFNLEKVKAFAQAREIYIDLLKTFPVTLHADELTYKIGVISIYVLRDLKSGRDYFEQLVQKPVVSSYVLAGLYQLGLLKQWEEALAQAKEYYNLILAKAGETDPERAALTRERLNELEQNKPLDYNVKLGLDTALKEEFVNLDMSKLSLKSSDYLPEKDKEVNISSTSSLGPTGCLQVELQYLWSGDLGSAKPLSTQSEFPTTYKTAGTKVMVMVLVAPEGIIERGIDLIDAH
ncbi:MAG: hypothetical protein Q7K98_02610 [Candidatus Omnitrophota bacterium]|nr:hypothetical protein [Candidatus Omnitrophota bacterium]